MLYFLYRCIVAGFKYLAFLTIVFFLLLFGSITYIWFKDAHKKLLRIFSISICKLLGIDVEGQELDDNMGKGYFIISNHCSYIDIPVIGTRLNGRFTPKKEIKYWPMIGWLTTLSMPIYINRKGGGTIKLKEDIKNVIESGENIIIFPEGTTNNGREIKKFKTSLFDIVLNTGIKIQPIIIKYTAFDGKEINEKNIDRIAWHGDMTLVPHLLSVMHSKGMKVKIEYLDKISADNFKERKELANHSQKIISEANLY